MSPLFDEARGYIPTALSGLLVSHAGIHLLVAAVHLQTSPILVHSWVPAGRVQWVAFNFFKQ